MPLHNWGGTYRYLADTVREPETLDELSEILRSADKVRVVVTRHSFTGIADAETIVGLAGLGERFEFDRQSMTVTIDGAMTYGRLIELLAPHGLALQNLASLAHVCIAGAVATGTHGSGDTNGNLATAVVAAEIMNGRGEIVRIGRGDPHFAGVVVSLGALGPTIALTLEVEKAYEVEQHVIDDVPLDDLVSDLDGVFASGYSVSAFTHWGDIAAQVWVKHRVGEERQRSPALELAREATSPRHPVPGADVAACTEQLRQRGSWAERLPHFRVDAIPSAGAEIQSEYFVPRESAVEAIAALRAIGPRIQQALLASEVRTVAADSLWLSPCHERSTVAFHFTWRPDERLAEAAATVVEEALRSFEARPHWGKLFTPAYSAICDYPRRDDALGLIAEFDPRRVFENEWLRAEALSAQ